MLTNLISNAVKFTPHGGNVWVKAGREGKTAVLSVIDTGTGIPEADLTSISSDSPQRSRHPSGHPGNGAGLTIAKAIVSAHHGTITVTSTEGDGSVFKICLPLSHPSDPTAPM